MKSIRDKQFFPAYLFYGEENYIQDELIRKLADAYLGKEGEYGLEKIEGNLYSPGELFDRLGESNIFSPKRLIVIIDPPYMRPPSEKELQKPAAGEEPAVDSEPGHGNSVDRNDDQFVLALESLLEKKGDARPDSILVFKAPRVDRRKRYFKLLDKHCAVIQCSPLKGRELSEWIKRKASDYGKSIEYAAVEKIMMSGNLNLTFLRGEIEKFATFLGDDDQITAETIETLFSGDLQSSIFTMLDALTEDSLAKAHVILERLLHKKEKPLQILAMLFRHYRLLLETVALEEKGTTPVDFAAMLGVPSFAASKLRRQVLCFSSAELAEIINILYETDKKIKTGRLEPDRALHLALERIDHAQKAAL